MKKLSIEKTGAIATLFEGVSCVSLIIPIFTGAESVESNFSKDAPKNDNFDGKSDHNNHCNENHEKNKINSSEKNNNNNNSNNNNNNDNNKNNNDLKEKVTNILDSDLFFSVYLTLSFLHLGWSLLEFSQAYTVLKNSKNDIKSYKKRLEDIKEQFDEHKEKLGILPDDFKESLEKIKEVFNLICQDYFQLEILIKEIYEKITIVNSHKNKSTLGLIGSGIFGAAGIAGGILIRSDKTFWYGISVFSNILSAIGHTKVIIESQEEIKNLKTILEDAKNQREKFLDEIDNLIKIISNMEKGQLPKLEENTIKEKYFIK